MSALELMMTDDDNGCEQCNDTFLIMIQFAGFVSILGV